MDGTKAVGGEDEGAVAVVERRGKKHIAHGHAEMLPTGIEPVVVVVVDTAHLFVELRGVVVVDGAALVVGAHGFDDHSGTGAPGKVHFEAEQAVEPTVFVEGGALVFEEVVVVETRRPRCAPRMYVHGESPSAHRVARGIGIAFAVGGVAAAFGHKGIKGFAQPAGEVHWLRGTEIVMDGAAELRSHFGTGHERHHRGVGADAHVARFFVIAHAGGVASALSTDGAALPVAVELHAISEGAAEGDGHAATESRPPTGNAPCQGGGRHGVATEHKRAGGEAGVVERREVGAEPEGEM